MKTEILETFTFGDVRISAEKVVGRKNRYGLRVGRVVHDEFGPTGCRPLFETDIVKLEQLSDDLARASIRMSVWLQDYAECVHRREKPEVKSSLNLRLK